MDLLKILVLLSGYLGSKVDADIHVRQAAHLAYPFRNHALAITEGRDFDFEDENAGHHPSTRCSTQPFPTASPSCPERTEGHSRLRREYPVAFMTSTIELEQEADGPWIAEVPQLPGVLVYGETQERAAQLARALAFRVIADQIESGDVDARSVTNVSFAA